MCDNCSYDKIKLLHDIHRIVWFIEKFCHQDAKSSNHDNCQNLYKDLVKDLEKHADHIRKAIK